MKLFAQRKPKSLRIATLLDKRSTANAQWMSIT